MSDHLKACELALKEAQTSALELLYQITKFYEHRQIVEDLFSQSLLEWVEQQLLAHSRKLEEAQMELKAHELALEQHSL